MSAVQQAGEALQQLTRVAPAQLAAAAAEFEQQGALPPDVAQRVQALGKRLAGAATSGGGAPQLSYRWPPPPPLAAAATARGGARAGKGSAGQYAQLGRQAVQFEAANPAALSSFLEGKYLAPESPGIPQLVSAGLGVKVQVNLPPRQLACACRVVPLAQREVTWALTCCNSQLLSLFLSANP